MRSFLKTSKPSPGYVEDTKLLMGAFPKALNNEVEHLLKSHKLKVWSNAPFKVNVANEKLNIPYRLLAEPFDVSTHPATEQAIYHCLFSRSTDGHVREASIRALLALPLKDWMVPYLFLALSDYVIQVADVVAHETRLVGALSDFASKNQTLHRRAIARVVSYWDLNRREGGAVYASHRDFPPFKMLKQIRD